MLAFSIFYLTVISQFTDSKTEVVIQSIWAPANCVRRAQSGDYVRYHYYGMLANGHVFDSSYDRGGTYNTYIGSGWLIKGMDQALEGMCVNEHRFVSIPPHLGYGDKGTADGAIPANSTLLFNVILVDVWNDDDKIQISTSYKPEGCERVLEVSDYVRYHYNGTLLNGKLFHSSYEEQQTYNTYVGQGWLIKGMDEGLLGACQGECRRIIIPPHMAYGGKGDGKNIPSSATVVFDVDIIDFHNPKDDVVVHTIKSVEDCSRHLEETDFVRYHYNGTLADGSLFDSSYQRHSTYDTYVGYRRLIPGVERGLLGACMGEWRTITMPPHLAYGERGVEGKIPGSAVLTFNVHIIDFHNPNDSAQVQTLYRPKECEESDVHLAEEGDYLSYDYILKLMDGTEVESSKDRTGTWGSYIGKHELIFGLERGLLGACKGEKRRVVIPPHLGYGEPGKENLIPGSAVLDFILEIHSIEQSLPEGYHLVWIADHPKTLEEIDYDEDGQISVSEFTSFIFDQVDSGNARLRPDIPREEIVVNIFNDLDEDSSGGLDKREFKLDFGKVKEVNQKQEL